MCYTVLVSKRLSIETLDAEHLFKYVASSMQNKLSARNNIPFPFMNTESMGVMAMKVVFLALLLILLPVYETMASASSSAPILRLKRGHFDPVKSVSLNIRNFIPATSAKSSMTATYGGGDYYIVQFDGKIQSSWKDSLKAFGVTFFDYIPEYAYIIKADSSKLLDIEKTTHVRWLGDYAPELRVSDEVYDVSPKNYEKQGGMVPLNVTVFPGEDASAFTLKMNELGAEGLQVSESAWGLRFRMSFPLRNVELLAAINGVKWVESEHEPQLCNNVSTDIMEARSVRETIWPASNGKLYGEGQTIAICDTGIDKGGQPGMHTDFLNGQGNSRIQVDTLFDDCVDLDGHGTHVAGIGSRQWSPLRSQSCRKRLSRFVLCGNSAQGQRVHSALQSVSHYPRIKAAISI